MNKFHLFSVFLVLFFVGSMGCGQETRTEDAHTILLPKESIIHHPDDRPGVEYAISPALHWLARHQHQDGHWGVISYTERCGKIAGSKGECAPNPGDDGYDVGVTALSLLAFLGAGYYQGSKDVIDGISYGSVVGNGLKWLMDHQDAEGCLAPRKKEYMYNHLLATLAVVEAYGLSGAHVFKMPAQKAVNFTVAAQNPGLGWRYVSRSTDNDSSITGWAVMALWRAKEAGLNVPDAAYDGARAWYDSVTMDDHRVGYVAKVAGKVAVRGFNEQFDYHETLTSFAILSKIVMNKNLKDPHIKGGIDLLIQDPPVWNGNSIDCCFWFIASMALFQYDGPDGELWKRWNSRVRDVLLKSQNKRDTGDRWGSWEPVDRWSFKGGRVYVTAINQLTLEMAYCYAPIFGTAK